MQECRSFIDHPQSVDGNALECQWVLYILLPGRWSQDPSSCGLLWPYQTASPKDRCCSYIYIKADLTRLAKLQKVCWSIALCSQTQAQGAAASLAVQDTDADDVSFYSLSAKMATPCQIPDQDMTRRHDQDQNWNSPTTASAWTASAASEQLHEADLCGRTSELSELSEPLAQGEVTLLHCTLPDTGREQGTASRSGVTTRSRLSVAFRASPHQPDCSNARICCPGSQRREQRLRLCYWRVSSFGVGPLDVAEQLRECQDGQQEALVLLGLLPGSSGRVGCKRE